MMTDNPVSWAVLAIVAAIALVSFFIKCVKLKSKPKPKEIEYDQDLIFFDQGLDIKPFLWYTVYCKGVS